MFLPPPPCGQSAAIVERPVRIPREAKRGPKPNPDAGELFLSLHFRKYHCVRGRENSTFVSDPFRVFPGRNECTYTHKYVYLCTCVFINRHITAIG